MPHHHHHHHNNIIPAIVSNPSSVETGGLAGQCVPDPLALNSHSHGNSNTLSLRGGLAGGIGTTGVGVSSMLVGGGGTGSPVVGNSPTIDTEGSGNHSPSSSTFIHNNNNSSNSSCRPATRYSDGAPIIAGTAAAQMEAIATATAARITSITNEGVYVPCEDVVNAVASLDRPPLGSTSESTSTTATTTFGGGGSNGTTTGGSGVGGGESRAHGFASAMAMGWGVVTTAPPAASSTLSSKALSWVDYKNQNRSSQSQSQSQCPSRVTPDDTNGHSVGHHVHEGSSSQSSSHQVSLVSGRQQVRQQTTTSIAQQHQQQQSGGGMDILAEIICHVPPMATTTQATSFTSSYPPHHHHHHHQTSYQESSHHHQHQQYQVQAHQAQHAIGQVPTNGQQHQDTTTTTPMARKRAASIPSYQEIYQEMGWSPSHHSHQQQQQLQHQSQHHYNSGYTYSVEEVQVDHHQIIPAGGGFQNTHGNSCSTEGSSLAAAAAQQHHQNQHDHYNNNSREQQQQQVQRERPPTTHFGHVYNRDDIEEGKELYTRKDLGVLGGHLGEHKDVHGNMREGCDSLCITSLVRMFLFLFYIIYY